MSMLSPNVGNIYLLLVLSTCQIFGVDALVADNGCSSRQDGRCIRCDGVPQCFDLSDEVGCSNTTMKLVPKQQAVPTCTGHKKTCLKRFPEPPPLPPFSLCDGKIQLTTTTQATTHISTTIKTTHVPTNPWPTRPTITWQLESTTRWPVYKTTTVTPPLSTTQWMPTTTKSTTPSFMEVFWFCSSKDHLLTNILDCVMRIFRCYRPVGCRGLANNVTPPPDLAPTQLFSTHSPFDHVTAVPHKPVPAQLYLTFPPSTNSPDYYYKTEQTGQPTQNDMAYLMLLGQIFNK